MTDQEWRERMLTDLSTFKADLKWLKTTHEREDQQKASAQAKGFVAELARLIGALLAGAGGGV